MKKIFSILLALMIAFASFSALAENTGTPPEPPQGSAPGNPPSGTPGNPPDGAPGNPPDGGQGGTPGQGGGPGGGPGGQSSQPESYAAVSQYAEDTTLTGGDYSSAGKDENAILISGGTVSISDAMISRMSGDSTGGDSSSFYGVGAAVLVTGGKGVLSGCEIDSDAAGGAGVFAYGDGVAYVSDSRITTAQGTSGGVHVAGGGTLYARNLTVETSGASAAAIRSDRGGGTMVVDGGTYTSHGSGSPALYCTADISVGNAALTATGSEALCLEGKNTVRLFDTTLTGAMPDNEQNDNTWTVILYQSMSGDSQVGEGKFEMVGGTLKSENGGLLYTTNTESEFILSGVTIDAAEDSEYFLRCTGNANQRGWGASGANGAQCKLTAIAQQMPGNVLWDSISKLNLYVTQGSVLSGAILDDESCAGAGGTDGCCNLYLDADSSWMVSGDSVLTNLYAQGAITDEEGKTVSIVGADGNAYVTGDSAYTVTVWGVYATSYDGAQAGTASSFSDYAVEF